MSSRLQPIDLRPLAETRDCGSRDSYLSFYADLVRGLNERFFDRRARACRAGLAGDAAMMENFDATYDMAVERLRRLQRGGGARSAVVFASELHDFFRIHELDRPVDNLLVVDSSPYIRPLARLQDDWETAALALLDQQNFHLFVISVEGTRNAGALRKEIMNRHRKGGCSQARFQRLRQGAIRDFLAEAAETTARTITVEGLTKLIVAGQNQVRARFITHLPPAVRGLVIGEFEQDFKGERSALLNRALGELEADERREEAVNVEALRAAILTGGLAVHGLTETQGAVRRGQAELLLVSRGLQIPGWKCERCQRAERGKEMVCPGCSGPSTRVDLIEELVERASRTGAQVDFIPESETLEGLGRLGALLRYK